MDACCAVDGNDCHRDRPYSQGPWQGGPYCYDRASSSDWLFGLWPGPPQRFEATGTDPDYPKQYQWVQADFWPLWGGNDLSIGDSSVNPGGWQGTPGGLHGKCPHGDTYEEKRPERFCGNDYWGATDVEVWCPR